MESHSLLIALASVLILGIGSQWAASLLKWPSIFLLLVAGLVAGPVAGLIVPQVLFGDLLSPLVSLAIAVILFEGATTLNVSELKHIGRPLLMLLTVGVAVTWVLTAVVARYVLGFGIAESILLGSVLTVTGPTVVVPLLQHIRPVGNVAALARWEGIVVDPVGAILAVLTFAAIRAIRTGTVEDASVNGMVGFVFTFLIGAVIGLLFAGLLREVLRRHWVNDRLDSPLALTFVILAFVGANGLQHEAGLVAVTVMGLVLANQTAVDVSRIIDFKENLTVLLIGSLFIVLTAQLQLQSFADLGWRGLVFLAAMVFLIRPVSVMLSTLGCGMPTNERLFLSCLAPRGIVAASVASVFAADLPDGRSFVAAVFLVIAGTVMIYGMASGAVARRLGLSIANPQGILIAGAHPLVRAIALTLQEQGILIRVVDTNRDNIREAQLAGIPTFFGNVLSEELENLELGGLGRFFAMTRNEEINLLATHRGGELFERRECYRLSMPDTGSGRNEVGREALNGRVLFGDDATCDELDRRFAQGDTIKATKLSAEFTIDDFRETYPSALLMFVLGAGGILSVVTSDSPTDPGASDTVIALVSA